MTLTVTQADSLMTSYEVEVERELAKKGLARFMSTDVLDPIQTEANILSEKLLALTKLPEGSMKRAENEVRDSTRKMRSIVRDIENKVSGPSLGALSPRMSMKDSPSWTNALRSVSAEIERMGNTYGKTIKAHPNSASIDDSIARVLERFESMHATNPTPVGASEAQEVAHSSLNMIKHQLEAAKQKHDSSASHAAIMDIEIKRKNIVDAILMNAKSLSPAEKSILSKRDVEVRNFLSKMMGDGRNNNQEYLNRNLAAANKLLEPMAQMKETIQYRSALSGGQFFTPRRPANRPVSLAGRKYTYSNNNSLGQRMRYQKSRGIGLIPGGSGGSWTTASLYRHGMRRFNQATNEVEILDLDSNPGSGSGPITMGNEDTWLDQNAVKYKDYYILTFGNVWGVATLKTGETNTGQFAPTDKLEDVANVNGLIPTTNDTLDYEAAINSAKAAIDNLSSYVSSVSGSLTRFGPASVQISAGTTSTLAVIPNYSPSDATVSYQWYRKAFGQDTPVDSTATSYTTNSAGTYLCKMTVSDGTTTNTYTSPTFTVTVLSTTERKFYANKYYEASFLSGGWIYKIYTSQTAAQAELVAPTTYTSPTQAEAQARLRIDALNAPPSDDDSTPPGSVDSNQQNLVNNLWTEGMSVEEIATIYDNISQLPQTTGANAENMPQQIYKHQLSEIVPVKTETPLDRAKSSIGKLYKFDSLGGRTMGTVGVLIGLGLAAGLVKVSIDRNKKDNE